MTDAESTPTTLTDAEPGDADAREGIRDRSVREVVERTRDVIRKTRELLDNSRDLLDRVRHRDGDKVDGDWAEGGQLDGGRAENSSSADDDAPGEHDGDGGLDDHAGVDARPVEGRA